ncbi:STAS domain-containing protein [Actinoplanes sp. NPDC049668]|uniref:STAS domain-containing protein n=1 Tax=unclassified Actinoplanes TaxID=2626549 RepID=UPI00339F7CB8
MCDERVLDVEQPESRSFFITLDRGDDRSVQTIIVVGEIDALNAGQLHKVVLGVLRKYRPSRIEINMFSVGFLDSAGIRVLLLCHSDARLVDCELRVTDAHPTAHRILQITGLAEHFGLADGPLPGCG